jgi:predicted nuclease of predicted toxin-antitoxin system
MNISPATVQQLKNLKWDIIRVSEIMDIRSKDTEILLYAKENDRVIITQDIDFSTLLAISGSKKPSVINLRLEENRPDSVTKRLLMAVAGIENELAEGAVLSVDEVSIRYRLLPITGD